MTASDRYDSLIAWYWQVTAEQHAFDETADWRLAKCLVRAESNFDPRAISPVGARGLMQIMKATWGEHFDDAFNPETNIQVGLRHLGFCWSIFQKEDGLERWKFALGAYNAGQGNIIKAQNVLARAGRPQDQWREIVLVLHQVTGLQNARQTINYVRRVMSDYLALRAT